MGRRPTARGTERLDGWVLAGCALLVYVCLRQEAFVNQDARFFVTAAARDQPLSTLHPLYSAIGRCAAALGTGIGIDSTASTLTAVSMLGTALAVKLAHSTVAVIEPDRARQLAISTWFACLPVVVFFATTIEATAVLQLFSVAAAHQAVRWYRSGSHRHAIGAGLACGIGAFAHASGHVLWIVTVSLTVAAALGRRTVRELLPLAWTPVAYGATVLVGKAIWGGPEATPDGGVSTALSWFAGFDEPLALGTAGLVVSREWLLPFLPASLLVSAWVVRPPKPGLRLLAAGFHAMLLGYLWLSFVVIPSLWERGTYLAPLALPAVVLAARGLRTRALVWATILSAVAGLGLVLQHDRPQPPQRNLATPAALADVVNTERVPPILVTATGTETDRLILQRPSWAIVQVHQLVGISVTRASATDDFDRYFEQQDDRGGSLLLTDGAWSEIQATEGVLRDHIRRRYRVETVRRGRSAALRLARQR